MSLFVFFMIFALTQWRDYLVGERTYITLRIVATSLLVRQVFVSMLATLTPH